jgi:cell wall-associated NlpC family hydrolase
MRRRAALLIAMACALATLALAGPPAAAAPTVDPRAQLAAKARALDATIEHYHTAQAALARSKATLARLDGGFARLVTHVATARHAVGRVAVALYEAPYAGLGSLLAPDTDLLGALTTVAELGHQRATALAAYADNHAHLLAAQSQAADLVTVNTARTATLAARAHEIQGQIASLSAALNRLPPAPPGGGWVMPVPDIAGTVGAVIQFAFAQLGKPYRFAANGPDSYDCSGLTMAAYAHGGVRLYHAASVQLRQDTTPVARSELRPGDLVFYNHASHVALYVGAGMVIHAPQYGEDVKLVPIDRAGHYYAAGRPKAVS